MTTPLRKLAAIGHGDVRRAYKRWAPVYDRTFGKIVEAAAREAAERANRFSGRLLEVGVGTGLALPLYKPELQVTGVDLSPDMLERARERAAKAKCQNVEALIEMDAQHLDFEDASFDITVAMFVMTVVPDPVAVMHELARVTRPGGTVLIVNHFSVETGIRGAIEKRLAGFADLLGWRPEFPVRTIFVSDRLKLVEQRAVRPFGFFTMLEFERVR